MQGIDLISLWFKYFHTFPLIVFFPSSKHCSDDVVHFYLTFNPWHCFS